MTDLIRRIVTLLVCRCLVAQAFIPVKPGLNLGVPPGLHFTHHPQRAFISLSQRGGNVDISLDLSVPVVTIPLDWAHKAHDETIRAGPPAWFNINLQAATLAGILVATSAIVVPLLNVKEHHSIFPSNSLHSEYKTDTGNDIMQFENTINDMVEYALKDGHVTPCLQRAMCASIAQANSSKNLTSFDAIVNGISSNWLFDRAINGTVFEESILKGRRVSRIEDCARYYRDCKIVPPNLLANLLKAMGL